LESGVIASSATKRGGRVELLAEEFEPVLLGCVRIRVALRAEVRDAKVLADEFPEFSGEDLVKVARGRVSSPAHDRRVVSRGFSATVLRPIPGHR
jgi:hypothetical protein